MSHNFGFWILDFRLTPAIKLGACQLILDFDYLRSVERFWILDVFSRLNSLALRPFYILDFDSIPKSKI